MTHTSHLPEKLGQRAVLLDLLGQSTLRSEALVRGHLVRKKDGHNRPGYEVYFRGERAQHGNIHCRGIEFMNMKKQF